MNRIWIDHMAYRLKIEELTKYRNRWRTFALSAWSVNVVLMVALYGEWV